MGTAREVLEPAARIHEVQGSSSRSTSVSIPGRNPSQFGHGTDGDELDPVAILENLNLFAGLNAHGLSDFQGMTTWYFGDTVS